MCGGNVCDSGGNVSNSRGNVPAVGKLNILMGTSSIRDGCPESRFPRSWTEEKIIIEYVYLYPRPFSDIDMNDLEQGQGHLIRGQMKKITSFFGCDDMSMLAKL